MTKSATVTLSVTQELKRELDSHKEINWSEVTRAFLAEKVKRLALLKRLDKMLENSEISEEDCLRLGTEAKKGRLKALKEQGLV